MKHKVLRKARRAALKRRLAVMSARRQAVESHRRFHRAQCKFVSMVLDVTPEKALLESAAFAEIRAKLHGLAYRSCADFLEDMERLASDCASGLALRDVPSVRNAVGACKEQLEAAQVQVHSDWGEGFPMYGREPRNDAAAPSDVKLVGSFATRTHALAMQQWHAAHEALRGGGGDVVGRGRATARQLEHARAFACSAMSNFEVTCVVGRAARGATDLEGGTAGE